MIPHDIVFIKVFPLNANGKVDLKLLQRPDSTALKPFAEEASAG
jgi:hypothetical protein